MISYYFQKIESLKTSSVLEGYPKKTKVKKYSEFLSETIDKEKSKSILLSTVLEETYKKHIHTADIDLYDLIQQNGIYVYNEHTFKSLIKKLDKKEHKLLYEILNHLLENEKKFHIEVYPTDGDIEQLYFVVHYDKEISEEKIEKDLFNLNEYLMEIDKKGIMWFVGFASERKDTDV